MKKWNINNILILIAIIVLIIGLVVFGARAYLYIRALLGNDLTVSINADKENLFLLNGESDKIKINILALSNLFCKTTCISKFIDLSDDSIIEQETLDLKLPRTLEYVLNASKKGSGQLLYRFDIECNNEKTYLCQTSGISKKRSMLITLNYQPNNQEIIQKNDIKNNLENIITEFNNISLNLELKQKILTELNKTININDLFDNYKSLSNSISNMNESIKLIVDNYKRNDYSLISTEYNRFLIDLNNLKNSFDAFSSQLKTSVDSYNALIDDLNGSRNLLQDYEQINLTLTTSKNLSQLIKDYNNLTVDILLKQEIIEKVSKIDKLKNEIVSFNDTLNNEIASNLSMNFKVNESLNDINLLKINIIENDSSVFVLPEQSKICCLDDLCKTCCDDSCNNKTYYPIILLHGHSFNEKTSAELSLDTFEDMQRQLELDGYLNAGSILISANTQDKKVWETINRPITVKASYYFDILTNQGNNLVIETKTDNLDTYTIRLKDIINSVKYKTGKDKVIIVAHSMGGLIARRYIQVFGDSDVDRLILIATPNHGISGSVLSNCYLFGTSLECKDMDEKSLFLNKLNNEQSPNTRIFNIIGTGCDTDGVDGDGIVTNKSAYLDYANNVFIKGDCNKASDYVYLHNEILNFTKYPQVYDTIKQELKV